MKKAKRERLLKERKKKRLTQAQVAEKIGLSRVMYTQIENGDKGVTLAKAFDISAVLGKTVDELFGE